MVRATIGVLLAALALTAASTTAAQPLRLGGSGACAGTMERLLDEFRRIDPGLQAAPFAVLGSSGALRALASGALDFALTARALSEAERAQGLSVHEYGRTPFVIAVAEHVPVERLTRAQLVQIYSGESARWPDRERVRPVLRPELDIDMVLLSRISPEMAAALDAAARRPGMIVAATDRDAADTIEKTPGAIGASTLALILSEGRRIRPLALDGAPPTVEALSRGAYTLEKRLHLVWGPKALGPEARRFIEFVQSARGREILRQTGHVVPGAGR